jgi:phage/plasmid-associated DNA primase
MAKMEKIKKPKSKYILYSVINYFDALTDFINNNMIVFTSKKSILEELKIDKNYHFRIHNKTNYIFFGDLDNYNKDIYVFRDKLRNFLNKKYNLTFENDEFKFTKNNVKEGSYHYSIPKWNLSTEKLKEIHTNFLKLFKDDFCLKVDKKTVKCVDTSIYSEHWFRCPNQSKGNGIEKNQHTIIEGNMEDFLISYIPTNSINIENVIFIDNNIQKSNEKILKNNNLNLDAINSNDIIDVSTSVNNDIIEHKVKCTDVSLLSKDNVLSNILSKSITCKKIFDECYKPERFEVYQYWIEVGMAIKNTFKDEDEAFDLFNYYSSKGSNYEGYEKTKYKYKTFIKKVGSTGITVATIYYYAIEDNKTKFIEIMNKNSFELGQTDMCKYLKMISGYKFIYIQQGSIYKLFCFNGRFWENNDVILKKSLSNELYDFLKIILIEVYWNHPEFNSIKAKIEKLKLMNFKKDIVETYKEYGVDNKVKFDDKWWLIGFNNIVYDMEEEKFRDYRYEDYVSITTGYDWREPTDMELETVWNLIDSIMPIKEERDAYLQILSSGIDGRCIEKFIVFNGSGGNGKGVMDDLMITMLGNYGLLGNNGILFENSKTGSNPEKANLHKKRFVLFREPPEKKKFENAIIKELTGGGIFSARSHHEKETEKELNLTMIVECNKRPLFSEEPTNADVRRIIDIFFRSSFDTDDSKIDHSKYIFKANPYYKTKDFQNQHKFALFKILTEEHKKFYKNNGSILNMPKSIVDRTNNYLELSCNIVQWFKENYDEDENEYVKIQDIYETFKQSQYFIDMTKTEKSKYTRGYFFEYITHNIFFRKYYNERHQNIRNVIKNWKKKDINIEDEI